MKKTFKKWLVTLLSAMMVFSSLTITAAAEGEEYDLFIGFGGDDAEESGGWGFQFNSPNADNNVGDIQAVTEKIKVGETKTVSLTLPAETLHTYWIAPVLVAEGVSDLSVDVQVSIDGNDVTGDVDFAAGDAWWYEGTGEYDETKAIRLAGGYNEWGTQDMESPQTRRFLHTTMRRLPRNPHRLSHHCRRWIPAHPRLSPSHPRLR